MTTSRAGEPARRAPAVTARPLAPEPIGALTWLLLGVVLLPIVVAIVRVLTGLGSGFHATSDNSLNELLVRDVGRHPVLLGPYSRDEWSHPGPLFYYFSAIPYRLFGANSTAMLVDALLINGIAVGVMVTVAKRWGGLALAVPVVLLSGVLIMSLPSGFLENPWNPYITVLPFGAFLMAAWAGTCGDRWAYPVAAFIGTFCMQTHIGYVALVGAVLLWCGWRVWRDRKTHGLAGLWWAVATLAVLWFAPVLEQIIHDPGNIRTIVHYFRTTTEPAHTVAEGARVMAAQFNTLPDWLVGLRGVNPFSGQPAAILTAPVPVLLVPFVVAIVGAFRSGDRRPRRMAAVLGIPLVVGIFALAQTVGSMYEYRLRWIWVLAGLCMAFTVAQATTLVGRRIDNRVTRPLTATCVAAAIVLGSFGIARTTSFEPPDVNETKTLALLAPEVLRHLPAGPGIVRISANSFSSGTYLAGLTLALERAGVQVNVDHQHVYRVSFGDHRVDSSAPVRAHLILATGTAIETVAARRGARQIAYASTVSRARRARALREFQRLNALGVDAFDRRFAVLGKYLVAAAVFSVPISHRRATPPVRSQP